MGAPQRSGDKVPLVKREFETVRNSLLVDFCYNSVRRLQSATGIWEGIYEIRYYS